jgi:MoaA/NifB/PqqE/SkfB family radical SAM enzyme
MTPEAISSTDDHEEDPWARHLAPPRDVIVEASSRCNFRCPLCLWTKTPRHGYMDIGTFVRFIDGIDRSPERLCFSGRGEPTLNPQLFELLARAVEAGIPTDLTTNGSSLLADCQSILDSGIDNVNVSIDADNATDYVRYRVNGNFDEVVAGMARLADEKRRRGAEKPALRTVSVIFNHNAGRLDELRRFFTGLGFERCIFKSAHLGHGQLRESESVLEERWLPLDTSLVRLRHRGAHVRPQCGFLHRGHLLWNGDICRCGIDHVRMIVGNVNEQRFDDIWTGPVSRRVVREIVAGEFEKCAGCWLNTERHVTESKDVLFLI